MKRNVALFSSAILLVSTQATVAHAQFVERSAIPLSRQLTIKLVATVKPACRTQFSALRVTGTAASMGWRVECNTDHVVTVASRAGASTLEPAQYLRRAFATDEILYTVSAKDPLEALRMARDLVISVAPL